MPVTVFKRMNLEFGLKLFIPIYYAVGLTGILLPETNPLFTRLIPFSLLLSYFALSIFHPDKTNKKSLLIFLLIGILGFVAEAIGVNTGLIFGHYQYGNSLGFKIFNTPAVIGLNWLFLVYASASVLERAKMNNFVKIILSSALMLVYDIVLEQVAPRIDMWHWENDSVPFQNYLAWFVISVIFHSMIKGFEIKTDNKLAPILLISQFMFFLILFTFLS